MTDRRLHSGSRPRIAVFGAGAWGWNHIRTLHELGALALVCEPDPARRSRVEGTFPGVEVCAQPEEALDRDGYQGVVVVTPAPSHAELGLTLLEAGKDVLVEKPLALDLESGRRLVQRAEELGAVLMVGHVLEYHPGVRRLRQVVADGELGTLRWAASNRLSLGKLRPIENVLWSFAPHDIAILMRLAGSEPRHVTCRGSAYLTPGIEDVAFLGLSFHEGFEAQVSVSWLHPTKEQRLVVVGDRAMAVFDDVAPVERKLTLVKYEVDRKNSDNPRIEALDTRPIDIDAALPLTEECLHFLDRIADREQPLTDGWSGLRVLRVLEACSSSMADSGAIVSLEAVTRA